MRLTRKELVAMIEEETERTQRLAEVEVRNVKEPLSLQELDMLDLLLSRADLYGTIPDGHDPDVFAAAIEAANDLYKAAQKQVDQNQFAAAGGREIEMSEIISTIKEIINGGQ